MVLQDGFRWPLGNPCDVALFGVAALVEGMLAGEHLEDYDAHGPNVDTLSVPLACSLLRCHEKYGAHDFVVRVEDVCVQLSREPEVSDLGAISLLQIFQVAAVSVGVLMDENVVRLQISVNKILLVQHEQAFGNALGDRRRHFLFHYCRVLVTFLKLLVADGLVEAQLLYRLFPRPRILALFDNAVEGSAIDKFHLDKYVPTRVEDLDDLDDILVLQLLKHLLLHKVRLEDVLAVLSSHYLDGDELACFEVQAFEDDAEGTDSEQIGDAVELLELNFVAVDVDLGLEDFSHGHFFY